MSMQRSRWFAILSVSVALAFGLLGCGEGSGSNINATARYFNGLIGVTGNSVDFISPRGGAFFTQANQVGYGTIAPTTGSLILSTDTGAETFHVTRTGTTAPTLAALAATLISNTSYLVATAGVVGQVGQAAPRLIIRTDFIPALTNNQSAIRVVHLSPDAPNIDLFNTPAGGQPAAITGLTNIAYTSASNYTLVASGNYNLTVREAGTGTLIPTQSAGSNVGLVSRKAYTIFIIGLETPTGTLPAFDIRVVADN
jgi:hypothetical protein